MSNNKTLKALMKEHSLTRAKVAELAMVNPSTVDRWLAPQWIRPTRKGTQRVQNPTYRNLPDSRLQLIRMNLDKESQ